MLLDSSGLIVELVIRDLIAWINAKWNKYKLYEIDSCH